MYISPGALFRVDSGRVGLVGCGCGCGEQWFTVGGALGGRVSQSCC